MLGIVIVNFNSYQNTFDCVQSLFDYPVNYEHKIYIVDNGSSNNSFDMLWNRYCDNVDVTLIKVDESKGYSAGLNRGIEQALRDGCEYFLLCNNDLIFPSGTIDNMIIANQSEPTLGVIGTMIIGVDNGEQKSYKHRMTYYSHLFSKKPFAYFYRFPRNSISEEKYYFDGMVSGCCFLLSKLTISKIGLLDENIFLFYEEDAIAYKLYKEGLQALLLTNQKIIHFGSVTIGTQGITYYLNRYKSSMYVLKKYSEINNLQLSIIFFLNYFSLLFKSIKSNEYKKACKELLNYYIELCRGT